MTDVEMPITNLYRESGLYANSQGEPRCVQGYGVGNGDRARSHEYFN